MLTVVAVNAALIFFALQSWSGVVTPRAFERGLDYNRLLAAAAREDQLGWQAEIELRRGAGDAAGSILVHLSDRHGRPIEAALVAELSRPLEAASPVVRRSSAGWSWPLTGCARSAASAPGNGTSA